MSKLQTLGGGHDGYTLFSGFMLVFAAWLTWLAWSRTKPSEFSSIVLGLGTAIIVCGMLETVFLFPLSGGSSLAAGVLFMIVYLWRLRKKKNDEDL